MLHEAWNSSNDVLRGLRVLEQAFADAGDRRAVFATAYVCMTEAIEAELQADAYEDPGFIDDLTVVFAEYYRRALYDLDHGREAPACWRQAIDEGASGRSLVIQDLLLGMIAHIDHDLPLALADVTQHRWRASCQRDYARVLCAVSQSINVVQDRIAARYAPGLCVLDHSAGRVDEWVTFLMIRLHRERAWRVAMSLVDHPQRRAHVATRLDADAVALGQQLMRLRLRRVLRHVERLDLRRVPVVRRLGFGLPAA